ncbi:MBL fold metallo-hydrolase [Pseudoalteromonas piratica]|uniref:beta-lactamase n=1 Tax=Pseudoalteromonas piratica TaxID=1348114 RepID=A0A0A7EE44_9GAMM|nr:MBL fold metallo-hydrolase [Pseudoalteromonas piratica]AIY64336.1 hydrolase [Pseudoalteromonas piratica]
MKKLTRSLLLSIGMISTSSVIADVSFKLEKLSDNLHVLYGQGGNIAISTGDDGIYIVDDQFAKLSDGIKAQISKLKSGVPEFVINTHHHGDHTGGNENFANAGSHVIAHHNVYSRLKEKHGEGSKYLPVISFSKDMTLHFNNEHAQLWHYHNAHTDGDAVIFYEKANAVHLGDIFFNLNSLPFVDVDSGGSLDGVIKAVSDVLSKVDGATKVIPGHGPVTNKAGLESYLSLLKQARELMINAMVDNKSLEDVLASKPLASLALTYSNWLPEERVTKLFYLSLKNADKSKHHH